MVGVDNMAIKIDMINMSIFITYNMSFFWLIETHQLRWFIPLILSIFLLYVEVENERV